VAWKGPVSEQLLQHPRRCAANGVADKIDGVRLVPFWEGTVALVTAERAWSHRQACSAP